MAASEKALIYGGDTHCALSSKVLRVVAASKDPNYVDLNKLLDLKLDERKAVQVRDTLQCVRLPSAEHLPSLTRKCVNLECWENGSTAGTTETKTAGSSERPRLSHGNLMGCPEVLADLESQRTQEILEKKTKILEAGDLRRTDSHLSEKSESDDEVSLVIADYCVHGFADDEAHYITTHEIQLSELDHDVDCDIETASTWDVDDDHQVYSFVDYASVDNDETTGVQVESKEDEAHRSTAVACSQAESDPGDRTRSATSDEKAPACQGKSAGHIHLSIKATSRAINKPSDGHEKEKDGGHHPHDIHTGDMSRCVLKDTKGEKACDGAKCLIALPGRLHFGSKFKGKDVTGYSSGTSSAVSELDDADKEVRNLTARAFRSLAYPYLDTINFSTSSESSASERSKGLNKWSAFVDLKYGNVSKGGGRNTVAHQSASSNFQLAKRREESKGITGLTLTSRRAPPVEIFALNGNLVNPKNASSTKKIEFMGKIGQGQSGVIRLTETLNFRCNVKAGPLANERRVKSARSPGGSRSADEVTNPRQKAHSKPACNSEEAMEDVHKKSIFASSILKNVISKKMQFEQERKMERGEICEPGTHEHEAHRDKAALPGFDRQSSKLSETGSEYSIVCLDELGDIVDSGSSDAKDIARHEETLALASETSLESQNCAAFDTKKGAADASRGALIRSQNSAFRSWKDEKLEVQTEHGNEQTSETSSKLTKMSRLFVPSIQLVSGERELEKPEPSGNNNREDRSRNTLYVSDTSQRTGASKSPEIKISLRSLRDNRSNPFSIAKLLSPNTGCSAGGLIKTSDESKYQALTAALKSDSADRIPHFTVRDVRDKAKLQAPIHQVRDVRKLVKSSYHFVSLDNNSADTEHKTSQQNTSRNLTNLPPIVIKCQSVNTNSSAKQSEKMSDSSNQRLVEDILEADGSHPQVDGINTGSAQINKPTDPVHLDNIMQEGTPELKTETKTTTKKQENVCDPGEKKADPKTVALEKLQAAVKTMEQLYVFDKNEWKRKSEPQPITDSHVLSLLSGEHQGGSEQDQGNTSSTSVTMRRDSFSNPDKMVTAGQQSTRKEEKETFKISNAPAIHDRRKDTKTLMHLSGTPNKKISSLSHGQKSFVPVTTSSVKATQMHVSSSSASVSSKAAKSPKSPKLPVSLNISHSKPVTEKRDTLSSNVGKSNKPGFVPVQFTSSVDSENYITIPVKPYATNAQQSPMIHSSNTKSHGDSHQPPKRSSTVMETRSPDTPTATIYHHPLPIAMHAAQPQVICFSPTVQPSPVPTDHFQATQRKMLLDPTTGNYYLVDTPVQPATRRLYDPETGQYVDVPMPQHPPMTPVPVPISPLALSPGGYGHTYMFYPGYMASTVVPARTIQSQLSRQSDVETGDRSHAGQQEDGAYMESPYYMPSGKSLQLTPGAQHITTGRVANSKVPVISISSQQGPRIIAPPSFDGTTMSFVVEHR